MYECPSCHNPYKWKKSMLSHLRNQCKQPPRFECPHCAMKNYQKAHMIRHLRVHHPQLAQMFWDRKLNNFFRYHILPLPFGQSMSYKSRSGSIGKRSLEVRQNVKRRGLKMSPSDKKKPFQCQKCGRGFTLKRNKDRHVNYECGHEPRFQCPYCGLRSKQTSPVYAHIRKKHPEEEVFIFDMKL
ncbi:zinc finger protein 425-like [Hylaeus anthracinus]|uniref:zinc finger protein 425-like n=1 Tax=Hylaeus anthracinus TaxID=313031 RepID=UPI0023B985B2|nr:zinc finger protein 425-like [Hylaeus anthracinus]